MYYKQLKDFLQQGQQKAFYVLSYFNVGGMVLGYILAQQVGALLPDVPSILLNALGIGGGLALTWDHQGLALYRVVWLGLEFQLRRLTAAPTLVVHAGAYYQRRLRSSRPFALSGLVSYSGDAGDGAAFGEGPPPPTVAGGESAGTPPTPTNRQGAPA